MSHAWMPFYVGDYLAKTQRLNAAEHGAYLLIIMEYWQSGSPPPDDDVILARICRMSPREWKRMRPAIETFFEPGWRHHRVEEELLKADAKHSRRVEAGSAGGKASAKAAAKSQQTDSNAASNAASFAQASSSHSPPQKKESPPSEALGRETEREALAIYNAKAEQAGWPVAQILTKARAGKLKARLQEAGGIDGWRAAMERAANSKFLCGASDSGWKADLDFFLQAKSFTKLMEGSYDDREGTRQHANGHGKPTAHDALLRAVAEQFAPGTGQDRQPPGADAGLFDDAGPGDGDQPPTVDLGAGDYERTR